MKQLIQYEKVQWEVFDHFPKQTFRNRYDIVSANGVLRQTIPVVKPFGSKSPTRCIEIDHDSNWAIIHWRGIQAAYASSPYFDHYAIDIQGIFTKRHKTLVEFNLEMMLFFLNAWGFCVDITLTETFQIQSPLNYSSVNFSKTENWLETDKYTQVLFQPNQQFVPNSSLLDLLFCEGPLGRNILLNS